MADASNLRDRTELLEMCTSLAAEFETAFDEGDSLADLLDVHALDVTFSVSIHSPQVVQDARVLLTYGGPTVELSTSRGVIAASWGGVEADCNLSPDLTAALDEWAQDLFDDVLPARGRFW